MILRSRTAGMDVGIGTLLPRAKATPVMPHMDDQMKFFMGTTLMVKIP